MPSITTTTEEKNCYHCGDPLGSEQLVKSDHNFCCPGCATVFSILEEKDLCNYYSLDSKPGISPKDFHESRFEYLEDSNIQSELLNYKGDEHAQVTFQIPQMHCASCVWLLEKLYQFDSGIFYSRVNFPKRELSIKYNHRDTSLRNVVALLASLGYEPFLSLASIRKQKGKSKNQRLTIQIGLAGFAFGNIMLFSIPDYLDFMGQLSPEFRSYFGWVSLVLALPVLLFADVDYLKSAWGGLKKGIINLDVPLSLGMITLFCYSLAEVVSGMGPGYFDSFTGLVFFLLLGKAFQQKTFEMLSFERDYRSFFPLSATIIVKGERKTTSLERLKPGDRVFLKNEDLIPADGYLLKGDGLIDYSFVTGESIPEPKTLGELVYAGGKQKGGAIEIELSKEVSNSYLTELWNQNGKEKNQSVYTSIADKAGKYFTIAVVFLSIAGFIYWAPDYGTAFKVFAAILIVACPCALALSAPYTFGNAIRILSKVGCYLKKGEVLESLSQINTLIFDKTGTLTQTGDYQVSFEGVRALASTEIDWVSSLTHLSSHPISEMINKHLGGRNLNVQNFNEVPGSGIEGMVDGHFIKLGNASWLGLDNNISGTGLEVDGKFMGLFSIKTEIRKPIPEMIQNLKKDYELGIISGDSAQQEAQLRTIFPKETNMEFGCSPASKEDRILVLKGKNKKVCMIGDGLNDAGALSKADVGIGMTEDKMGFAPACDVILDKNGLEKLAKIFRFSKQSLNVIRVSFAVSILYNLLGLWFAFQGLLSPVFAAILMPLSSVTVVLFTTGATNFLAFKTLTKS